MQQQHKEAVKKAVTAYLAEHKITAADLAIRAGINQSYLSQILNGKYVVKAGDKDVTIGDKYFEKLAATVGLPLKKAYWETVNTVQFQEIISTLKESKESGRVAMIIGETGCGKTNAVNTFCNKNPRHTIRLTVSSAHKAGHIINELCDLIGIDIANTNYSQFKAYGAYGMKLRLDRMAEKLADIRQSGGDPIIILDEAENLECVPLKIIKGLYDALKGECSLVLIGTPELPHKILRLKAKGTSGMAQLWRRFKAGQRILTPLDRGQSFAPFLEKYVSDQGLAKLLITLCDNYGELNDYLEPALKEADKRGVALTEELFRLMYNMPKR